ncbi:monovalent cation/H+ antiporter complex subunit F [Thalassomonas actiniarum]|uniref:PH regulation protein F n=1 Tax=Thalassomonas actiniarum TaxID=485447 RepID=A0AAF0C4V6_9GAMM|nr:monovalent cation/H+ antiporter complex subunit F [Thalassomonas actiniarum]WDE02667.1 pH regulation protein F [Thalassomonas actiniarum]
MLLASILAIFIIMFLALLRAYIGPSLYDRILAANLFGTKTVLFIAVLGFLSGHSYFLDIAMLYALLNFVSIVGVLRFVEYQQPAQKQEKDREKQ